MNKDKTIKDLKERNDKLLEQYRLRDFRCITIEKRLETLELENRELKKLYVDAVADYELEHYKNLKAIEYLKQPYRDEFDYSVTTLLEILGEE